MGHKRLVVGTGVGFFTIIVLVVLMGFSFSAPETINPFAALTAAIVALVGFAWFKKTSN
jgi:hypothetical protein